MSQIGTIYERFECDTPGCPSEFSITRHWRESDGTENPEILDFEMLEWAAKLGWTVKDEKAFCTDCKREGRT
jgi:hypothetical protein